VTSRAAITQDSKSARRLRYICICLSYLVWWCIVQASDLCMLTPSCQGRTSRVAREMMVTTDEVTSRLPRF
jgi:hypothetical protein